MSEGKVQVYIRSRKAPAAVVEVVMPRVSYAGLTFSESSRSVKFESRLDEEHRSAVEEGRRLADQLGLELEVVDLSRSNPLRRVVDSIRRQHRSPKLVITPSYAPAMSKACAGASVALT